MSKLWIIPIEPLPERYSDEWYRLLPEWLDPASYEIVDGVDVPKDIKVGSFLDANNTVVYKASQLAAVAQLFAKGAVSDGDTFFVADIEFWGIEVLRVLAKMNGVNVRLVGFLHACSYTRGDAMEQMAYFQKYTERGWCEAFDTIMVGSEYQKKRLAEERSVSLDKIVVTGNPLFPQAYPLAGAATDSLDRHIILIANRFDAEKKPRESVEWALAAAEVCPELSVHVCTSRSDLNSNDKDLQAWAEQLEADGKITIHRKLSKTEYHSLLLKSRIVLSNSEEESFGYCIHEAQAHGAIAVAKPVACHTEFVHSDALVCSKEDFTALAAGLLEEHYFTWLRDRQLEAFAARRARTQRLWQHTLC